MSVNWLHISDLHIREGDSYSCDVVLQALIESIRYDRNRGIIPRLIFFTGDIAYSGKAVEYQAATPFFDNLLDAAGLSRRELFVVPGNHDVDRWQSLGLVRTFDSADEVDEYFNPTRSLLHLQCKQAAFVEWYNTFFEGIRSLPSNSTCGPIEVVEVEGRRIAILPINSALFALGDDDQNKLWIGRRCLDAAKERLRELKCDITIALLHHPLYWLHNDEYSNIKSVLHRETTIILSGHLHGQDVEGVSSEQGEVIYISAGAVYQTRKYPNRIFSCTLKDEQLKIRPLCYYDHPTEVWTIDPSLFPREHDHAKVINLPVAMPHVRKIVPAYSHVPTNIPARLQPVVGRDALIAEIVTRLGDPLREKVLVLHGHSGVGKSELACEAARQLHKRYPGGAFLIEVGPAGAFIDFFRIGETILGKTFPDEMGLQDRCKSVFFSLGGAPTLLIYDNVQSFEAVQPWLPTLGMCCHVLITTIRDNLDPRLPALEVPRLSFDASRQLIKEIAGEAVDAECGEQLARLADGLPIQLCSQARELANRYNRYGELDTTQLAVTAQAQASFHGVYALLDVNTQFLLRTAAFLTGQHIPREELSQQLMTALGWTEHIFRQSLDTCLERQLMQGKDDLSMHQLLARYLLDLPCGEALSVMASIRATQRQRFIDLASKLYVDQANATLAAILLVFPLNPEAWDNQEQTFGIEEGEMIGNALCAIGRFAEALPWYRRTVEERESGGGQGQHDQVALGRNLHEVGNCLSNLGKYKDAQSLYERAVKAKEQGDGQGRVDQDNLGRSYHEVGYCLSCQGFFIEAQSWYERAVKARQQGDLHECVDLEGLGWSLHGVGFCLSSRGLFTEAQDWYGYAVSAKKKGDIHGRVDQESLGRSLHEIGYCLSNQGQYEEAQSWYEHAVEARQKGDIHGRIDHEGCGGSLHEVGNCLVDRHCYTKAQEWFQRAAKEREQGDVYGRVDYEGLGCSLHEVGYCLVKQQRFAEAQQWFQQAVEARQRGDIHGRVNPDGLGSSLHETGYCLATHDQFKEAYQWFERTIAAKRKGDIFGHVNSKSLAISLREGAHCLRILERHVEAQQWEDEAGRLLK